MIVPSSRLLHWVALLVVPFATVAGLLTDSAALALALVALFALLAAVDALLGWNVLAGIRVTLPGVVRLSKDRAGALELLVANDRARERDVRLGLPLPREFTSPREDLVARLPADAKLARLTWPCTPSQRGRFPLTTCHLEAASPFGLWAVRGRAPVATELRVYPNLLTERRNVAALFLNRGNHGAHTQRAAGRGRDFEKLREYIPGDGYDEIHWKATAKRGRPVTKVFQIERTQEVYVVIDASRLSARPAMRAADANGEDGADGAAEHATVLERMITAGLVLGLAAEQQGDLFGLVTFTDRVENFVRAKNGQAHYSACRDALYTLQPKAASPDFEELMSFLRVRLRRRALLVFLTALDDPVLAEGFTRGVELIGRQHLVLVNMVLPPGVRPAFENAAVAGVDDLYRELGGHLQWQKLRELEKTLQHRGVKFSLLEDERFTAQLVAQYLGVKRRQLL